MIYWVCLLRSVKFPDKVYLGLTTDLERRLKQHNSGVEPGYTARLAPWRMVVAIRFDGRPRAEAFERYLKSGSGHAFARRHFW